MRVTRTNSTSPASHTRSKDVLGASNLSKKADKPVKPALALRKKRDEVSPRLALTAAARVQSPLRSSEELSVPPPAALAVVGSPKSSPFVKRMPLFIQRHVHPEPALQPGSIHSFSSTRLILHKPHPSAFAPRPNKRSRDIQGANGESAAQTVGNSPKRARTTKRVHLPTRGLKSAQKVNTRERSSSLSSLTSLSSSESDLTSLDSGDEEDADVDESPARADSAVLAAARMPPSASLPLQQGSPGLPFSLASVLTSMASRFAVPGGVDERSATPQGELKLAERLRKRRDAVQAAALLSTFKSSKPFLSPVHATKPLPPPPHSLPNAPATTASALQLSVFAETTVAHTSSSAAETLLQPPSRSSAKSKGKVKVEVISLVASDEESEDEVEYAVSPGKGGPNAREKFVPSEPLPTLSADDSDGESVEGDWEEISEDEYYRSHVGSSSAALAAQ
ncbi:hypothetical protein JCM3770_000593 [Rhodotorula araucariae]